MKSTGDEQKYQARVIALRRLAAREYSSAEMAAYLQKKGIPTQIVAEVIAALVAERLLDDERYLAAFSRYQAGRGRGPAYVRMKLKQKGISAELSTVKNLLDEASGQSEFERARHLVETRYAVSETGVIADEKAAMRAYQLLLRRGFSYETAKEAVFGRHGRSRA